MCFYCRLAVNTWQKGDNVWWEHVKHSNGSYLYVNKLKDTNFHVDRAIKEGQRLFPLGRTECDKKGGFALF